MNFFPEIKLETEQAEAIAKGLFAIARSDGLHEREAALVASFWSETGGSMQALAQLERSGTVSAAELAAALTTDDQRRLFVKTALLLAFADGQVTGHESTLVRTYTEALGLSAELSTLETQVKEFLLSQLSHIANTDALVEIAKKLKI
ncbi:MAG TPA: TerB family tellurite resistance protein [Pseudomonadota bacterium]|jgi:tellurite resistance protein|nr:TerB family tellurite resistance protein [Deltaproteobacteria bacterium]HPH25408.1 TerB family tellurite resistance protein [Pseudomonadota bacterium]